jgi:hypothetical protein
MPQFDAETIVDPIKIRLLPYVEGFDWTVIAEPSDRQIGEFMQGLKEVMSGALKTMGIEDDVDLTDPAQMMTALDQLEPDKFVEVQDAMAAVHAALCSECPSKEQLLQVPMRRRMALFNWLQGEVLNPEVAPGGGNAQVTVLPSRAAG